MTIEIAHIGSQNYIRLQRRSKRALTSPARTRTLPHSILSGSLHAGLRPTLDSLVYIVSFRSPTETIPCEWVGLVCPLTLYQLIKHDQIIQIPLTRPLRATGDHR